MGYCCDFIQLIIDKASVEEKEGNGRCVAAFLNDIRDHLSVDL